MTEYNWSTDFPLKLQKSSPQKGSQITAEFELTPQEIEAFRKQIGSKLNGTLPISLVFHQEHKIMVGIPKPGRGQLVLTKKAGKIADFIAERIEVQYIPAVRTAESAQTIVDTLVEQELETIEKQARYQQALEDIAALQEPILQELSRNVTATMRSFLPNITQAKIRIESQDRSFALRGISEILLDDGAETSLEHKGDGVQSLAALALMRHASTQVEKGKDVLIALEEPESHLHPNAIRQLQSVLAELSNRHQVVITTHNPIFTNRFDIHQNIIVSKSKAYPAKSVKEVRDVLGVRLDDNLSSAEVILLVEGEEDRIALRSILPGLSPFLKQNLETGRLAIDVLGGAGNLSHRVRLHSELTCRVHAFLDDDNAGRAAVAKAKSDGLLALDSANLTAVGGKSEAELEDIYKEDVYKDIILTETGLELIKHISPKSKWTSRVKVLLRKAGKPEDDQTILAIKIRVAHAAGALGADALHEKKKAPIESMVNSLTEKLKV